MWESGEDSKIRSNGKMYKKCKIRFSSFVNFCESPNFRNQEIDIVVVVFDFRGRCENANIGVLAGGGSAPPDPPRRADAALVWDYAATFLKFVKFWLKIVKIMTFAWRWEVGGGR